MNVNGMGSPVIRPGDILAIPLPGCASMFPNYASDYGLVVANGTYTVTAGHCVQCSCSAGDPNLYCTPASLTASCSSMQCNNSNLMLGNFTSQPTSAGCNVTSCNYNGFVNGTIITKLTTSLQPQCPGPHRLPPLIPPPATVTHQTFLAPSPSPMAAQAGGPINTPKSSVPGSFSLPANGPAGSASAAPRFLPYPHFLVAFVIFSFVFNLSV
ncbi:LysM domain-containing GPI-anchored protein 1 [Ananas comosus]|uniref:LysM domain-containing GPI-anchored protein 1 n=2 Tax=Ananas comosus TaxID=4615 RepID=A0A199UUX6_ANACO|nr:LysM domain-containing GPI-anchored protein 1 [Ananas comosus]CAD1825109.1 unnamed protein product [Ananas comosus var. bracteatus]